MTSWQQTDIPNLKGKIAIVTGANSGLGYETSLALARKNAHVIMACRSINKAEEARAEIIKQVPNASLEIMALDLGSLDSVRAFSQAYLNANSRLDLLYNNAGVMAIPRTETADSFEMQFGINHLGHFALTGLLIETLINTPNSRVVSVSSGAAYFGQINFDDLQGKHSYTRYGAYGQSKLANVIFALELDRRLKQAGASTISNVAHPGLSHTNLQSTSTAHSGAVVESVVYPIMMRVVAQSGAMGALPQLYAGLAPEAKGGVFYGPRRLGVRGYPKIVRTPDSAKDKDISRRLWEVSEELTGVQYKVLSLATASV